MKAITVYVLQGATKRYVGITADLERRLSEHRAGSHAGGLIGAFVLLHTENFPDYAAARVRERFLKSGQGREWLQQKYPKCR
jgi:predicted GIY-YIG superfamily endonuclease